jgi:glycosyltransferase involved in cell wall biosynthesis
MKKLLVIIPFYNVEEHLEEAIEGVLQQTYQNWHLILVDDASTDNSRQIAERYKDNDKIDLLYNTENKGCYYSVNKALLSASNQKWDYWHYHGGDDVSDLTRFEKIMGYLKENPKVIGCKTTFVRVHYDSKQVDVLDGQPHIGTSEGIAFYSRVAFDSLGYYDDTRFGGDTDYFWRLDAWIKANNLGYQLGEHKECLYIAYLRKTNLVIQYDWTYDRPKYWQKSRNEIQRMTLNNNFHREIF